MPFGMGSDAGEQTHRSSRTASSVKSRSVDERSSEESWESSQDGDDQEVQKADTSYQPHNEAQVQILAKKWIGHVQQRAAKIWSRAQVLEMLETIAR